jgi:hypothetical protein
MEDIKKALLKKKGIHKHNIAGIIKGIKAAMYGYGCGENRPTGLDMGRAIRKGRKR